MVWDRRDKGRRRKRPGKNPIVRESDAGADTPLCEGGPGSAGMPPSRARGGRSRGVPPLIGAEAPPARAVAARGAPVERTGLEYIDDPAAVVRDFMGELRKYGVKIDRFSEILKIGKNTLREWAKWGTQPPPGHDPSKPWGIEPKPWQAYLLKSLLLYLKASEARTAADVEKIMEQIAFYNI